MISTKHNLDFQQEIQQGIPDQLPEKKPYPKGVNQAPKRKDILNKAEKKLAIRNALRYFPKKWHEELAQEFLNELNSLGRIYTHRFKPSYKLITVLNLVSGKTGKFLLMIYK